MNTDKYINEVIENAKAKSYVCLYNGTNSFRSFLANLNIQIGQPYYPDRCSCLDNNKKTHCDECVVCKRCGIRWLPNAQPFSIHSNLGDYDKCPEVYIANNLVKSWMSTKSGYKPHLHNFISNDIIYNYTEDEIYNGLIKLEQMYPNIKAWISFEVLYYPIILRWKKVLHLLNEWMERRNTYFTPSGVYGYWAENTKITNFPHEEIRVDTPKNATIGLHNIPHFLYRNDWSSSTMNADHAMEDWVNNSNDDNLLKLLSRVFASNASQWTVEECDSFHRNNKKQIMKIIAHMFDIDGKYLRTINDAQHGGSPFAAKVVWHSLDTKCKYCTDLHTNHYDYIDPTESEVLTNYQKVIKYARQLRQIRHTGVLYCATRLKMIYYRQKNKKESNEVLSLFI